MAVKIRLKRVGSKKNPHYRVVVADSRAPRDGRYITQIGTYNPQVNPSKIRIDIEEADKWLSTGAQPSNTVRALIDKVKAGEEDSVDLSKLDEAAAEDKAAAEAKDSEAKAEATEEEAAEEAEETEAAEEAEESDEADEADEAEEAAGEDE